MTGHQTVESGLAAKTCVPCRGGVPALKGKEIEDFLGQLQPSWRVVEEHHLEREYAFKDFREALSFVNLVGDLAEAQNHHPDLYLSWGKVRVTLWTHKIDGLAESDFIMAARIDLLNRSEASRGASGA